MSSILTLLQLALALSPHSRISAGTSVPAIQPVSSATISRLMTPGINLGNTLEAIPTETSWGNPQPNEAYFRGIRKAGFKSVRLPVAWTQYSDADHNIDGKWMSHVLNVVRMARKADLYVLMNIHWDGGWLQATPEKRDAATKRLIKFWQQIATQFRDLDDGVLFAGSNEPGVEGEYGMPKPLNAEIQNGYNQTFVSTVRKTGGRNRARLLVVQGYGTDIDACVKFNTVLPQDSVKGRLLMEVHFYSPYNFTLNDKSEIWQWGKSATDPKAKDTWGDEDHVDAQFAKMKSNFLDRGIPVVLGEYSAGMKPKFPGMDRYRRLWDEYVTTSAVKHGLIPILWDTGSAFDRLTGKPKDVEMIDLVIRASRAK